MVSTLSPFQVIVDEVAKRNRHSPFPMVEFHSAQKIVFEQRPGTTEKETVNLENCLNRILSEDVYAVDNLPPFPASIKDGYAVRGLDGAGVRFVRDAVAAGDSVRKIELFRVSQKLRNICIRWYAREDCCRVETLIFSSITVSISRFSYRSINLRHAIK